MLQNLLAERFKLTLHHETKELPMYALVVGKGGPKLKESVEDGCHRWRRSPGFRRSGRTFGLRAAPSASRADGPGPADEPDEDRRRWHAATAAGSGQERHDDDDDEWPHAHGGNRQPVAAMIGDAVEPVGTSRGGRDGIEGQVRFHAGFRAGRHERADGYDAPSPAPA